MATRASNASPYSNSRTRGSIGNTVAGIVNTVVVLAVALLVSLVIEWAGMNLWWPEEGTGHSQRMLEQELGYINRDLSRSLMGDTPMDLSINAANKTFELLAVKTGFQRLAERVSVPDSVGDTTLIRYAKSAYRTSSDYVVSAITITQVFAVRCVIILLSAPLFLLVCFAAIVDGLVQRELRKAGGGREYGLVYHSAKSWFKLSLLMPLFLYLASPFPTHPNLIMVPCAVAIGLLVFLTSSTFKKYL